jgi:hypothetical protein
MLTILQDQDFADGHPVEIASAEGISIRAAERATCRLAQTLMERGHPPDSRVRLVRANPWLYGPPFFVGGITLATASRIDFFAADAAPSETPQARF